jgi:small-conductance mechanosensitive channel
MIDASGYLTLNNLWILAAVGVGVILFFLLRHWTPWLIDKMLPEQWRGQKENIEKSLGLAIVLVGGILLALAVAAVAVTLYGVDLGPTLEGIGEWLVGHGIRILGIIVVAWLIYKILGVIMPIFIRRYLASRSKRRKSKIYLRQRSETLSRITSQVLGIFIIIVAFFMILSELGLDITPLLAGAGVAGIAIGFAAQNSIRDFIGGFMIMLEDHYNIGDVVKIADLTGEVEEISLRRTVIRDLKGILHVIPNGEIKVSSNYTRSISRAFFEVSVAYKEDLDKVMALIKKTWEKMAKDPEWKDMIISETPWLLRVEEFGDSGIVIRAVGDTRPMMQWGVMGELRRRIKRVFDKEGVEIPWPHLKLYFGESPADSGLVCKACSQVNLPGSKFCSRCGAKLKQ